MPQIPGYGLYQEAESRARLAYNQALAKIRQKRSGLASQYGFTYDVDPTSGEFRNFRVDPHNQFGLYQMLLARQGRELGTAEESGVSRGLIGAGRTTGFGRQPESDLRFFQGAEDVDFGRGFTEALQGLTEEELFAKKSMEDAIYSSQKEALLAAIEERAFDEGTFDDEETAQSLLAKTIANRMAGPNRPGKPSSRVPSEGLATTLARSRKKKKKVVKDKYSGKYGRTRVG